MRAFHSTKEDREDRPGASRRSIPRTSLGLLGTLVLSFFSVAWQEMSVGRMDNDLKSSSSKRGRGAEVGPCDQVYIDYNWNDLPLRIRDAAKTLGYDERMWDADDDSALSEKAWARLTPKEKAAAEEMGYDKQRWDLNETPVTKDQDCGRLIEESDRLIDFAVAGFEKCGTTFLLESVFSQSKQVFMAGSGNEVVELSPPQLQEFRLHVDELTSGGAPIRRGFKASRVLLGTEWLTNLQENFPATKLIVTTRHPVLWFQSWYNFKLRGYRHRMPTPHESVGLCREACEHKGPEGHCVVVASSAGCSGISNFHQYLSRLRYTPMDTEEELALLDHHQMQIFNFSQTTLFLMEVGQMDGKNTSVSDKLFRDMERFLDLAPYALPDIEAYRQPTYSWSNETLQRKINICHDDYRDIRAGLLDAGGRAARWIEDYFLQSSHVVISDRWDFVSRIRQWKFDPCAH